MKTHIFNVLVGGNSIGMTHDIKEALMWKKTSMSNLPKVITKVPYREPDVTPAFE